MGLLKLKEGFPSLAPVVVWKSVDWEDLPAGSSLGVSVELLACWVVSSGLGLETSPKGDILGGAKGDFVEGEPDEANGEDVVGWVLGNGFKVFVCVCPEGAPNNVGGFAAFE